MAEPGSLLDALRRGSKTGKDRYQKGAIPQHEKPKDQDNWEVEKSNPQGQTEAKPTDKIEITKESLQKMIDTKDYSIMSEEQMLAVQQKMKWGKAEPAAPASPAGGMLGNMFKSFFK